ncbi:MULTISPECIES: hypothetical protein [unclassified Paenibacillus]
MSKQNIQAFQETHERLFQAIQSFARGIEMKARSYEQSSCFAPDRAWN